MITYIYYLIFSNLYNLNIAEHTKGFFMVISGVEVYMMIAVLIFFIIDKKGK